MKKIKGSRRHHPDVKAKSLDNLQKVCTKTLSALVTPERRNLMKKYPVRTSSPQYNGLKTAKKWAALGFVPRDDATGTDMWTNRRHQHLATYYAMHEVQRPDATKYVKMKEKLDKHVAINKDIWALITTKRCSEMIKKGIASIIIKHLD